MTAALASAAATPTMASSSSGLAAARLLSRSFLCESGGDSLLQTPGAPGLVGPTVLLQATAGLPGAGPWRAESCENLAANRGPSGVRGTLLDVCGVEA